MKNKAMQQVALIDQSPCIKCTRCLEICPVSAITGAINQKHIIDPELCTGCKWCLPECPVDCITMIKAEELPDKAARKAKAAVLKNQYQKTIERKEKIQNDFNESFENTDYKKEVQHLKQARLLEGLAKHYGKPKPFLLHKTNYQHLVAILLSAQTTDKMVNKISPQLFKKAPNPQAMAKLTLNQIETLINKIGLYKSKARYLKKMAQLLVDKFNSKVPKKFEELVKLPGVGIKTANVYLCETYNLPLIGVDTHVMRLSKRFNLSQATNQITIEKDIKHNVPTEYHRSINFLFVSHGRKYCKAKKPDCGECPVRSACPYVQYLI